MSKGNFENQFNRYYAGKVLSNETRERLASLAEAGAGQSDAPTLRFWPSLGLAAGFVVALIGVGSISYNAGIRQGRLAGDRTIDRQILQHAGQPRYVVAKFQADMCPAAAQLEPGFAKLREEYACDSVLFVRFDVTGKKMWQQSKKIASLLGMECAFNEQCHSGTVMLIDCESGSVLETAHDEEELPTFEHVLARAVP